jgi:hypothetical protein
VTVDFSAVAVPNLERMAELLHLRAELAKLPDGAPGREVLYCCANSSVPARLLYTTDRLAFVQFETRHWAAYRGFSGYVTAAIFPEHLCLGERANEPAPKAVEPIRLKRRPQVQEATKLNGQASRQILVSRAVRFTIDDFR